MKRGLALVIGTLVACAALAQLPRLDDVMKGLGKLPSSGAGAGATDGATASAGIKGALAVGTGRAVKRLSRLAGAGGGRVYVRILADLKPESRMSFDNSVVCNGWLSKT